MTRDPASLQHRPFLTPIWLTILSAMLGAALLAFLVWVWGTADSTTVLVVRLAETASHDAAATLKADATLDAAGQACAERLSALWGDAHATGHVDALYAAAAGRDRLIAAPLAARLGIDAATVDADAHGMARRLLREHGGGRILVVVHGEDATALVEALSGAASLPPIGAHGDLYVIAVPRIGRANLLHMDF